MTANVVRSARSKLATLLLLGLTMTLPSLGDSNVWFNFPDDVIGQFVRVLSQNYVPDERINPFYLRGDFDGDGSPDYAILVISKRTGRKV